MNIATLSVYFSDFNLGLIPPIARAHAKLGVAAAGPYTPQRLTRGTQVRDLYVAGPLAGAAAVALLEAAPVIAVRVTTSVDGTVSPVTAENHAGAPPVVSGAANDAYEVRVTVTRAGAVGSTDVAVRTVLNGGDTGPEQMLPVSGALPIPGTGLTLTFAGELTAGAAFAFNTTAPAATVGDIGETLEALLATRPDLRYVHVLGTATPALAAAVAAILTERETRNYYTHALLEARPMNDGETPSDYLAAVEAQFASFVSTRVSIALDGGEIYNPLTRRLEWRNSAWKLAARRAAVPIGESAYRVRSGAMVAMNRLRFDAGLVGTTGRFASLRTFDGRDGVYAANWPMLAPTGSDFDEVQQREVIDRAAQIGFLAAGDYLGDDVPVDVDTGRILETEALAMEAFIEGRVRAGLRDNASGVRVRVDRDENILSTRSITFELSVIPLGYMKHITVRVGFVNPMLAALATAAPAGDAAATDAPAAPGGAPAPGGNP